MSKTKTVKATKVVKEVAKAKGNGSTDTVWITNIETMGFATREFLHWVSAIIGIPASQAVSL